MSMLETVLSVFYILTCRTWRRGENCTLQIYWVFKKGQKLYMKKYTLKNKKMIIGLMHQGNKTSANVHTSSFKKYICISI